jgi:hypothetical protein
VIVAPYGLRLPIVLDRLQDKAVILVHSQRFDRCSVIDEDRDIWWTLALVLGLLAIRHLDDIIVYENREHLSV